MIDTHAMSPSRRIIGWGPVLATVIAGLFAGLSWAPRWDADFLLGVVYVLDVASFATTGAFLLSDGRTGRLGWGMIGAAFCYAVSWWWIWPPSWQVGPAPIISFVCGYGWFVVGGLALVRYPEPALGRRHEQVYFATLASWVFGGKLLVAATSRPEWKRWNADAWWPTIVANERLSKMTTSLVGIGVTVLALMLPVLLLYRIRRSQGIERADMLPATAAAVSIGVVGGLYLLAVNLHVKGHITDQLRTLSALAALVAPVAFIVSVIQHKLKTGLAEDKIRMILGSKTIKEVESALRAILGDDTLVLAVQSDSPTSFLAPNGYPFKPDDGTRWQVEIPGRNRRSIGVLLVDPALQRREELIRAAAAMSGIALENGVLQRDLATKLSQSQTSRQRLTRDSLNELQRIGHELHDLAQSSLQAVQAHLTSIRINIRRQREGQDHSEKLDESLNAAQAAVQLAVNEVRSVTRGIYPEALNEGLLAALQRKFGSVPMSIMMNIDDQRTDPDVEQMMYLLVCEAVTNALKHAYATRISVTTTITSGVAIIRVSDDGRGGAHKKPGSGLAALDERVRALQGELTLTSESGTGTTVRGVIPCE